MAAKSTLEKWPTRFDVVEISESLLGNDLTFYFLTGVLTEKQSEHFGEGITAISRQKIDSGKVVVSALLSRENLEALREAFEPLSKSWRGQYFALANAVVDACKGTLKA